MERKKSDLSPLALALSGALLLCGGWLLAPFPVLIFMGISPLLGISEPGEKVDGSIFEKMELVLLALSVPLLIYSWVYGTSIVSALVMGILLTLVFVAHAWTRRVLGIRSGKITLVLFWLAAEYGVLKLAPTKGVFLADSLVQQEAWLRWNIHTGYLGGSAWVLLVNWLWYLALLGNGVRWSWITAAIVVTISPIIYGYTLNVSPITREVMVNLYENKASEADVTYLARGELVVRTAAWLSVLILLLAFVRQQTRK